MRLLSTPLLCLALSVMLTASCNPITPPGLQCSSSSQCPTGQHCATDGICYSALCTPACASNETCDFSTLTCVASDSSDDPDGEEVASTPDTRSHVGFVVGAPTQVLGTVVSPHVVITCSSCLGSTGAGELSFVAGGLTVGVSQIVRHDSADVAALFLETVQATPNLQLASSAPSSGISYACIVPSATASQRYQYIVTMTAMSGDTFAWTGDDAEEVGDDIACAMVGGPTFASDGSGDVLIGLHTRSACEGGLAADLRVDAIRPWIVEQMEEAAPDTCPATGTCSGECGEWSCTDDGGIVNETCTPDTGKCQSNQTCTGSLTCEDNAVCNDGDLRVVQGTCGVQSCSGGQWGPTQRSNGHCTSSAFPTCSSSYTCICNNGQTAGYRDCGVRTCSGGSYGSASASASRCTNPSFPTCDPDTLDCICNAGQYLTCPGDGCGRRYCTISTGDYYQCTAYSATCPDYPNESCEQSGSTFTCQ